MAVKPRIAVLLFPGTNCERETVRAVQRAGGTPLLVWHADSALGKVDGVIIPGGFSYGDYLRAGALARVSPIMEAVRSFADAGGPVLGICNGFQILVETGLLPGGLLTNASLTFIHRWQPLSLQGSHPRWWDSDLTQTVFPIAHHQGNYFAPPELLTELERNDQIVFRYRADARWPDADADPNGSMAAIAGITNRDGNVLGMMPHPERAWLADAGSADGDILFRSLIATAGGARG